MVEVITRKQAKSEGRKFYFTGRPCKYGHVDIRWVSSERCKECARLSCETYRHRHPEVFKEQYRSQRESGALKERQSTPSYRRWKALYMADYRKRHRAYYNSKWHEYRAAKLRATPAWADHERIRVVYEKANELSEAWGVELHVDHIDPLISDWVCGLHVWENLQILDASVNCRKNNGRSAASL